MKGYAMTFLKDYKLNCENRRNYKHFVYFL